MANRLRHLWHFLTDHTDPEPELPIADPYVLWRAAAERSAGADRFTVTPAPVTRTAAGPDFGDPTITVTDGYPFADTLPASGAPRRPRRSVQVEGR